MIKLLKNYSAKKGQPPGSLIHIGERKVEKVRITLFEYNEQDFREEEAENLDRLALSPRLQNSITWINIDGLHDVPLLERFGAHFNLHPLVLEDILNTGQRPKCEEYGDYYYIVLKMLYLEGEQKEIMGEQVSIILGDRFVLSFQERQGDVFESIRDRIKTGKGRIRRMGADYLAYCLLDAITDGYYDVLETFTDKVEALENKLIDSPGPNVLQVIYRLKRDVIYFRKLTRPLRELVGMLQREEGPPIAKETLIYLKDLYDHSIQVIDTVETLRDMVLGMLDLYLSSVSNRMNNIMKVLTIIATIFIPLTFVAGIYGMNFQYMPELQWRYGYLFIWIVMLTLGGVMLALFRKMKWL